MKKPSILSLSALVLGALTLSLHADEPMLAVPGKVIYENDLSATPGKEWKAAKGKWEAKDGALVGSELEADHHGAVIRLTDQFTDFVIDAEFKFEGAKTTSLTINALKDHMARILITPNRVVVRRDDNDHEGPDKAVTFAIFKADFQPGTWHKIHLEMVGDTMLGQVDDQVAWGSDPLFSTPKANPGFTAAGQSIALRNFTIREATLNPEWDSVKATLPKPGEVMAAVPTAKGKKKPE